MASRSRASELDNLKDASQELARTLGDRALNSLNDRVGGLTDRLSAIGDGSPSGKALVEGAKKKAGGGSGLLGGVKGAVSGLKDQVVDKVTGGGGGKSDGGDATSSTNIIESIDVGVPVSVAYNQWTEFGAFPSFMKKVENVEADSEEKLTFKAQIFLSHRTWEATILEQVPDERIVWRSKGEKGHVDGAVTFHELAPSLTRILLVLEYYPQGLFEKTGNLWRAQGRRVRAELKHFRRHVMTRTVHDPDEVEGWRGVIHDGEVEESHEEHVEKEQQEEQDSDEDQYEGDDEQDDEAEDEPEDEPEDEYDDEESDDEAEDEEDEPEDEFDDEESDDEAEDEEDEPEDEYDEDEDEYDDEEDEYDDEEDEPEDEYEEDEYDDEEEPEDEDELSSRRSRRRAG
jgi:uncharacterized membrane protein